MSDRVRRAIRAASLFFYPLLVTPCDAFKLFTGRALIFLIVAGLKRYPSAETEPAETINNIYLAPRLNFPLDTLYVVRCCGAAVIEGLSKIGQRLVQFASFLVGGAAIDVRPNGLSI